MSARPLRLARVFVTIAMFALLVLPPLTDPHHVEAFPTHPGKWTGTMDWNSTAVNMVLLPGWQSASHSRILWWNSSHATGVAGGLWSWNPPADAPVNDGVFPASSFSPLTLVAPPLHSEAPNNIFCVGQTMLSEHGKLLLTGGTALGEGGTRSAVIFNAAAAEAGQWDPVDSMSFRRWYSDNTLLASGKVVTVTGSSFSHYATVGGLTGATPSSATNLLQRYEVSYDDVWESSVVPTHEPAPPIAMEQFYDAGGSDIGSSSMFMFGGRKSDGSLRLNAIRVRRERNPFGSDYSFHWTELAQSGPFGTPSHRAGSAVVTLSGPGHGNDVLVIGGLGEFGPSSDVWRGHIVNNDITWTRQTQTGVLPALHGASAIYDPDVDRVFVFGGSSNPNNNTPTSSNVYSLQLGASGTNSIQVTLASASGDLPGARSYGSLTYFKNGQGGMPGDPTGTHHRAMLFGGITASGGYSDVLTSMWIAGPDTVVWQNVTPDSPDPEAKPQGRARHAAAVDPNSQWLVVSGGETAANTSSNEHWAFDLLCGLSKRCDQDGSNHWEQLEVLPTAVRGHCAFTIGPEPAFPRLPEVFTPWKPAGQVPSQQWTTLSNSPHWQEWYSFGFLAPRGPSGDETRVFYAGPEDPSSMLHLDAVTPYWTNVGVNINHWRAGSAVMYRPGKVMKCGTRDTGGLTQSQVVGRTAVIDLKASTPTWTVAAAPDTMIQRRNHNLVILPTGEVIVIGGARYGNNDESNDTNCVKLPEIWDPDAGSAGRWYRQTSNGTPLDASTVRRHYHSTAILLPDARVLVAGGNNDPMHQELADIYSPYYLFDANGDPATRPVIQSSPDSVSWGERFPLCVAAGGPAVTKVSLVRPGATTHGFDQNQRFLPLVVEAAPPGAGSRYLVTAPADSFDAPPGDYLLFALTGTGTPSIARWIKLHRSNGQVGHPTAVNNLSKICSQETSVMLQWTPPSGDSTTWTSCPGPAAEYKLKYREGLMPGWDEFANAATVSGLPLPNDPVPGQPQSIEVSGLNPSTLYTFRMISKNYASSDGNWSALGNALTFTTYNEQCGGSGGGGGGGGGHEDPLIADNNLTVGLGGPSGAGGDGDYLENTLFANVPPATAAVDVLRLPHGPRWAASGARIRLSQSGAGSTRYTGVRLRGVASASGQSTFAFGTDLVSGTLMAPLRVSHADGRDLSASLAADEPFAGHPGDTLLVQFADGTPGRLAITASGLLEMASRGKAGIEFQCEADGGWGTVAWLDPRRLASSALVGVPSARQVRLVFHGDHTLHGVERFAPAALSANVAFEPLAITHSSAGDLGGDLGTDGMLLSGGEHAYVDFAVPEEQAVGLDWFLEVAGEHLTLAGGNLTSEQEAATDALPTRFALDQNRPNPFDQETQVSFELPVRSRVRLEVFDLAGRRVVTLANSEYAPGRHRVGWNRNSARGRVPAGIYTCRLSAGGHEFRRQMVIF